MLTPYLRNEFADNTDKKSSDFGKSMWEISVGADKVVNGLKNGVGFYNQANIDSFGEQIPTAIGMLDPKLDNSLKGGWHTIQR